MISTKQALSIAWQQLHHHCDSARLDASVLLCHVLQKDTAFLYAHGETILSAKQQHQFAQLLDQRQQGWPIAYLTGQKEFWSLPLTITPDVLIPRPETELLVETILQLDRQTPGDHQRVLELGTGSGAIAIALSTAKKHWQIVATDLSAQALQIAKHNAAKHDASIQFYQGDWYQALPEGGQFDIIVSNPPYIGEDEPELKTHIRFEPRSALVADNHGLGAIQHLVANAPKYLKPNGVLLLEHGYKQAPAVADIFAQTGLCDLCQHRDLSGLLRITFGWM